MDYRQFNNEEYADLYSQYRNASKRVISNIITNTKDADISSALR